MKNQILNVIMLIGFISILGFIMLANIGYTYSINVVAINYHTIECYGDIPMYDGMLYEVHHTLVPGQEYICYINTGITTNNASDDIIYKIKMKGEE